MKNLILVLSLIFLAACGEDNSCSGIAGQYAKNNGAFEHDFTFTKGCFIIDNYCESTTRIKHLGNDEYEYQRLSTNDNPTCRVEGAYFGKIKIHYSGGNMYLDYGVEDHGTQVLVLLR